MPHATTRTMTTTTDARLRSKRRRRRRVEPRRNNRTQLWSLSSGLLLLVLGTADAGRTEVSWLHGEETQYPSGMAVDAADNVVVCGCLSGNSGGDATFYVAKFTPLGEQLWRHTLTLQDDVSDDDQDEPTGGRRAVCATGVATDAALAIYVTGSIGTAQDADVFVARLSPSGSLVWTQTLGTPFQDVATSVRLGGDAVFVGGYSRGDLALGHKSGPNCDGSTAASGESECDDGFVARLAVASGATQWVRHVAGAARGETRVFDVAVDAAATRVVVVGETFGGLLSPADAPPARHAGDVFVRRLDAASGATVWTTQLDAGGAQELCQLGASPTSAASFLRVYPRGRCGVALHAPSGELSVVGSTRGLLSTFPSQTQQYTSVCGGATQAACVQLFVARLAGDTGTLRWARQLVSAAPTTAERAVALDGEDVAVLGTASAGFFARAESMEQLLVLRVARDGVVRWTAELGLAGEDHAAAVASGRGVVVLGHGSADAARRGQASTQTTLRRVDADAGAAAALCVDAVGFATSELVNVTRDAQARAVLVQVPVRRDPTNRCPGAAATVRFRYGFAPADGDGDGSLLPPLAWAGDVHLTETQLRASLAIAVPTQTQTPPLRLLVVALEATSPATRVVASSQAWRIALDGGGDTAAAATAAGDAADGRVWRQLTWVSLVAAAGATALVVAAGRCCRCIPAWSWRRARVFEYKTLRVRRSSAGDCGGGGDGAHDARRGRANRGNAETQAVDGDDETQELRAHLEEIQQLNDSLDGLLRLHASSPSPSPSPCSSAASSPRASRVGRSASNASPTAARASSTSGRKVRRP